MMGWAGRAMFAGLHVALTIGSMACLPSPGEPCDNGWCPLGMECRAVPTKDGVSQPACVFPKTCGNGIVEDLEQCDGYDGPQPCAPPPHCYQEICGNGILERDEQCDDGVKNNGSGQRCDEHCKFNFCGNGVVDLGEQCDDGVDGEPRDSATCDQDCTFAVCGDGYLNVAHDEDCDHGDKNSTLDDTCGASCHFKGCGNGFLDATEQCDPNPPGSSDPAVNTSTCDSDCTSPVCGDGLFNDQAGEQCDQGSANGDPCPYGQMTCLSCDRTCHSVTATGPFCGDNQINGPVGGRLEFCDQGARNGTQCAYGDMTCLGAPVSPICNNDCKSFILNPNGPFCGDDTVQPQFEECDPGNGLEPEDTALCNSNCTFPVCGDGHTNGAALEMCDDRNSSACGTCSADCTTVTSSAAIGQITVADPVDSIRDGDTFTLHDGVQSNTFEFNLDGDVAAGHIAIAVVNGDTAAVVADAIITAINNGTVAITATLGTTSATVNLTNNRKTSLGNQTIGKTSGNAASFEVIGMSGGQGGDCGAGVGCAVDDDCRSAKCTNGRCL